MFDQIYKLKDKEGNGFDNINKVLSFCTVLNNIDHRAALRIVGPLMAIKGAPMCTKYFTQRQNFKYLPIKKLFEVLFCQKGFFNSIFLDSRHLRGH